MMAGPPDDETPDGFDADAVIDRWAEIEKQGHPLVGDSQ
jgi:hypothetical protein